LNSEPKGSTTDNPIVFNSGDESDGEMAIKRVREVESKSLKPGDKAQQTRVFSISRTLSQSKVQTAHCFGNLNASTALRE
jgi:hypothetical protein